MKTPKPSAMTQLVRWGALILKLSLSGAMLAYVYYKFGSDTLLHDMAKASIAALSVVALIQAVQIMIGSWRMRVLMASYGEALAWVFSIRLTFVGFFFSQTFISFIGGDGMRIWQMMRNGYAIRVAGHVVMADRIVGFVMLLALILLGLPFAFAMSDGVMRAAIVLISVGSIFGCLVFFYVHLLPLTWQRIKIISLVTEQSIFCRKILAKRPLFFVFYAFPHVLNTLILYAFLIDFGAQVNFFVLLSVAPPVFLLSMLPISFAGWGVREGALAAVLGSFGVDPSIVIAASIAFGLSHIVASLPGSVLWIVDAKRAKS